MKTELRTTPSEGTPLDPKLLHLRRTKQVRQWVELLSAVVLALATVATAWSGYQSALWNGEQNAHMMAASTANIRYAKNTNLAAQKLGLHTTLFSQWAAATSNGNPQLAGWLYEHFPEPLQSATTAWLAVGGLTNPAAPATPFDMPEYVLDENSEAQRWEAIAEAEAAAASTAGTVGNRYLLFTIIFATVLFFGGISGKFKWVSIDIAALGLGVVALLVGVAILLTSPVK